MTIRRPIKLSSLAVAACSLLLIASAGAASASSKRIAFVDSSGALFTVLPDGLGLTSYGGSSRANPSISTTGDVILFDDGAGIHSVGAAAELCATGTDPAISPSGAQYAYVDGGIRIGTVSPAACGSTVIASGTDPAWSPDSRQLVFVSGNDIFVVAATGGSATNLTSSAGVDSDPAWSPDGRSIAYVSGGELLVMDADGGNKRLLTSNAFAESTPSWSADSAEIVFARAETPTRLYAVQVSDGSTRAITTGDQPDWGLAVANTSPPTITLPSGVSTYAEGVELSANTGSWISINSRSFSYRWQRCGTTSCTDIAGATSGTYLLDSDDVGNSVRVVVTATTADGSAPGTSATTPVVVASAPKNVLPPTTSGTFILGGTVTAADGTWTGTNVVFTYQWQRCDLDGANCIDIPGATSKVYSPVSADIGKTLKVKVTGTNSLGSGVGTSIASPPVNSNIPTNTSPPVITEVVGTTGTVISYSATTGTWTGAGTLTYRYQWRRCDSGGANCRDIAGAILSTYTPAAADIGGRLRVVVTATNTFGSAQATSDASELLAGTAPTNTIRPSVSGSETVGGSLVATTGTWAGSVPLTYTYQWQRCNASGTGCVNIAGATGTSYIPTTADVGATITVVVTARNAAGTATATATPTDPITQGSPTTGTTTRPSNTRLPSFTGTLARGRSLQAAVGTWSGTTPMTFSYQWLRCPATGTAACTAIPLATRSAYTLVAADVGKRIRLTVTAANAAGPTAATSAASAVVKRAATVAVRRINGNARANRLVGTARAERIDGKGGNDRIDGKGGRDTLIGGTGNDTIVAVDGVVDTVNCGAGRDTVVADRGDRVAKNCERVTRRRPKK